ncbi:hypothetical protein ACFWY6_19910 [Streptomyces sp. NPDC059037]|uniref:hypothetical protein n=1 Tax=Streptomyces sp. NPDC059037 TaxID=3346710 RepID=UPI00367C5BD8
MVNVSRSSDARLDDWARKMIRGLPPMAREDVAALECLRSPSGSHTPEPAQETTPQIPEELLLLAGADQVPDDDEDLADYVLDAAAYVYAVAVWDGDHVSTKALEDALGTYLPRALAIVIHEYEACACDGTVPVRTLTECRNMALASLPASR